MHCVVGARWVDGRLANAGNEITIVWLGLLNL